MKTGWIGDLEEIPAAREAREVLADAMAPAGLDEERRELEARRAAETVAGDRADEAAVRAFLGGGMTAGEVLSRGEDPVDREYRQRLTRARELLRREGLGDLLPGATGGGILDPNLGYIPAAGSRVTPDEAMERAVNARDRRARERREAVGVDAIARSRAARPPSWGERMRAFVAGE